MTEPDIRTCTASDGYRWHYRRYPPQGDGASKGRVICLHGIQSHGGWYTHTSQELARAGYEVFYPDRRGSGLNRLNRGDTPSFRRLLDDLGDFVRLVGGPPRRTVLLAVSWGGKLAVGLCRRHPGLVGGLALQCPGFCPQVTPPLRERLGILWARLRDPTLRFPIPLNDPALFTASPRWQAFLREDPLALHRATARFLVESVRLDGYIRWTRRAVRVPVLLQLAGQDQIIDNARTRTFVKGFASPAVDIREYPGAHHTLEFEQTDHPFRADLLAWLGQRG